MEVLRKKSTRILSHLEFDMSLYDYMLSQLDITLYSGNPQIDHGFLKGGLCRGQKLELLFANAENNCDLQLSFAIRAILPHRWRDVQVPLEGQESFVIYYNINKSVSMLRLRENIEHVYTTEVLPLLSFVSSESPSVNQQVFVETCLKRFIMVSPNTSYEFALAIRSLPSLLKQYRPVGLVVIDSLNMFSSSDYEMHRDSNDPNRRSSIIVDPNATSFEIKRKGVATKKRKTRTYEQSLFGMCGDYLRGYWEEYKFPLIVTKIDNTSISFIESKQKAGDPAAVASAYSIVDLHLKKLESDQLLVISDKSSKLFEQLCTSIGFKYHQGTLLVSKSTEDLEYDLLVVLPKENTLYVEINTIDKKKIKLVN